MKPVLLAPALLLVATLAASASAQRNRSPAPGPGDLPALAARCGTAVQWEATDPRLLEEGSNQMEVMRAQKEAKDFDRAGALDKALAKAKDTKRLVLWYAPRIVAGSGGRQMYRPALLDGYAASVLFSDPDCVAALNRKFVCVRLFCDQGLGKRYSITAPEIVEPALFFLTPDGKLVRQADSLRSFNAAWLLGVLGEVLRANPQWNTPSPALQEAKKKNKAKELDSLSLARELAIELDFEAALAAARDALQNAGTEAQDQVKAHLLIASILRRAGQTADGLGTLDAAEKLLGDEPGRRGRDNPRSDLAAERGRCLLLDRRVAEAAAAFEKVRSGARKAEAQYHLGLCDIFLANEAMALRCFKEAVATDPESPWAWKSAANLVDGADRTVAGPALHGFEDPFAPKPASLAAKTSAVPREAGQVRELARDAVEYLLRMQRETGGWTDSRYAYWPTPDLTPNAWMAVTALSCAALLEWRELAPEHVDAAVRRGEDYLFNERHMARGFNEEIYADGYKLVYLSRKYDLTDSADGRKIVVDRMNQVVRELERTQDPGQGRRGEAGKGFWAHEYPNPFCTAAVMNGLVLAKARGATVPPSMLQDGAKALLSVRAPDGAFSYGAGREVPDDPAILEKTRQERLKNSMARSPICEAAILWGSTEQGSEEKLAAAMDNFWNFLPRFEKVRKCDFHTDGELAGFFWWHALFHTTEAIKVLPAASQTPHLQKMLELVLRLGESDGSFIDSHEMGKSYGTAMGLLTLKNLLRERRP